MTRKYNWKTGCDVEATLSVIGGRWKPVLVCHLLGGRKRFGELRRLVPNATERMITLQLRELEADGVVARHVFAEVPPRVEYEVTPYGRSLEPILVSMQAWGREFKARRLAEEGEASDGTEAAGRVAAPSP
ncbi:MAG: winged helix-turn-helix transcriptional regulator [Phycisphaerales bacterium JB059]